MGAPGEQAIAARGARLGACPPRARHVVSSHRSRPLADGWALVGTAPDAVAAPSSLGPALAQRGETFTPIANAMPVGAALRALGRLDLNAPPDLDASDWWFRCTFAAEQSADGPARWLVFDGLATIVEVWLNGVHLGVADDMFVAWEAQVGDLLRAENELVLCVRALRPRLAPRRPRARWRARLLDSQEWRWHRTSQLGRMPGCGPSVAPAGPWRPVRLESRPRADVRTLSVAASRPRGAACLHVDAILSLEVAPTSAILRCGEVEVAASVTRLDGEWRVTAELHSRALAPWWPHTHGEPALHRSALVLDVGGERLEIDLGEIGFRELVIDTSDGGFTVYVNGVRIFVRGSAWTPRDWLAIDPTPDEVAHDLLLLREAGLNCIRLSGCFAYGSAALLEGCARAGLLVWQDLMFSVLDYPHDDAEFTSRCEREVGQQLALLQGSPSIMAVCGSAEVDQQAAMMGMPLVQARHPLFHEGLANVAARWLPTARYWPSTPSGGAVPFRVNVGTSHYFGVGAYRRELTDARRAGVRFTTECLAFAHLPEPESAGALPLESVASGDRERWKARVPRDLGATWDFEDVRDHYVARLFDVDPTALRRSDPARYSALGRAASAIAVERTFQEWRRPASSCAGALTWLWTDPWSGAGWGVVDAAGRPKSAWYALRRACRPVALALTNEGLDGVDLHAWNDGATAVEGALHVRVLRDGREVVHAATTHLALEPRASTTLPVETLLGRFVDVAHAYRFGSPAHDVVHAVWMLDGDVTPRDDREPGARFGGVPIIDEAVLLVHGEARPFAETGLEARVLSTSPCGDLLLSISTQSIAHCIRVGSATHQASDSYFTLLPGVERRVLLTRIAAVGRSVVAVTALNDERARLVPLGESSDRGGEVGPPTTIGAGREGAA